MRAPSCRLSVFDPDRRRARFFQKISKISFKKKNTHAELALVIKMARYLNLATESDLISWVIESTEHVDIAFMSILFGLVENRLLRDQTMDIWKVSIQIFPDS